MGLLNEFVDYVVEEFLIPLFKLLLFIVGIVVTTYFITLLIKANW